MADHSLHRDASGATADGSGEAADASGMLLDRLAHDLRGPLSPLQTAAYLLRRPDIEPERRDELLAIIDRQTARLSAMVQEVSDWTRARQLRLVNRRDVVAPAMLVELAVTSSGADIRLDIAAALDDVTLDGDAQRLVQMLSTLIGFMQSRIVDGKVAVGADLVPEGVRIEVMAPGAPWNAAERDGVFHGAEPAPFDEGLGMRLMIAQAIAHAHDGDMVTADSGDGSALIRVVLPLAAAAPEG